MPLVVVTGLPGVGKSSVYQQLRQMGRNAWGSDEDGFLVWKDRSTKREVEPPADFLVASEDPTLYTRVSRERVEAVRRRERIGDVPRGILAANATWEADYRRIGATIIDASPPIDTVVANVLRAVEGEEV